MEDDVGDTALHKATTLSDNYYALISCLINSGANVNALTNDDFTPFVAGL